MTLTNIEKSKQEQATKVYISDYINIKKFFLKKKYDKTSTVDFGG